MFQNIDFHLNINDYLNDKLCKTKQFSFNKVNEDLFVKLIEKKLIDPNNNLKDSYLKMKNLADKVRDMPSSHFELLNEIK